MAISIPLSMIPNPVESSLKISPSTASTALSQQSYEHITITSKPIDISNGGPYQKPETISVIERPEDSILDAKMTEVLSRQFTSGYNSLSGIYGQMADALNTNKSEVSQTTSNTLFKTNIKDFDPVEHTERIQKSSSKGASTQLTIETKEGDKLTFNISLNYTRGQLEDGSGSYSSKNISIDMEIDGELNDEEKKAIAEFAEALDKQLTTNGTAIDFSQLNVFASDQIAKVDFSLRNGASASKAVTLKMTNTESERSIKYQAGNESLNISLDIDELVMGNRDKSQAIQALVKSLENGLTDAKKNGGEREGAVLIEATKAIFSHLPVSKREDTAARLTQSVTSGLPDFNISYNIDDPTTQNDNTVSIDVRQNTHIRKDNLLLDVRQRYDFDLKFEYYKPLPHLERPDFEYGNYIKVNGSENQTRFSRLSTDENGNLTKASISKQAQKTLTERTYNEGILTDTQHSTEKTSSYQDLIDEINMAEEENKLLIIDGILDHLKFGLS